ncbi:hypothetical protein HN371_08260 [Candidatus Poribacteria bacterium]|jgi:hypothetical protein|nr:hypothetical protein [Candidatus Poribacteria bacterium]MBT5532228.1 hypothetical protein [Candidatus Poribacteria bacterium]MBT7096751.1 hypothetical protein [Candidatus Poribacteria bacterium]MBT7808988.1 hypothetical protein [Candidatus Poribacteria bacterium]
MLSTALIAAVVAVLLLLVLGRILRVGCRLVVWAFYFVILVIAAVVLYSLLQQMEVLEQFRP